MKRTNLLLAALFISFSLAACRNSPPTLSLLVWEGYADPSFVHAFEISHRCKVVAASIVKAGLAAPLDLSRIPSYVQLSASLRDSSLVKANDQVFGVPFMWGPNSLLYDSSVFPRPPDSWNILWDPKYRGKISLWDELSSIYMAAQVLGYDQPDPGQLYNLSDAQLDAVKKKLIELKPNVRKFWSTGGELTNLFQNHEIVLAMGWPLNTAQLRKLNFPIGETIPKENTTGWIDHLMITSASKNRDLATEFLAYMVEAKTQKFVSDITHYTPANPDAVGYLSGGDQKSLHLDDAAAYMTHIYFWQDVPRRAKYNEIWNEVKAAQ